MIVVLFLLGTAAFYYQEWIKTLQPDFPAAWIIALILAFVLTYSPIQTFLTEADKIFLFAARNKVECLFQKIDHIQPEPAILFIAPGTRGANAGACENTWR